MRLPEPIKQFVAVNEMIDGLCMSWAVKHSPDLICMPDGRTRLLWRPRENPAGLVKG